MWTFILEKTKQRKKKTKAPAEKWSLKFLLWLSSKGLLGAKWKFLSHLKTDLSLLRNSIDRSRMHISHRVPWMSLGKHLTLDLQTLFCLSLGIISGPHFIECNEVFCSLGFCSSFAIKISQECCNLKQRWDPGVFLA